MPVVHRRRWAPWTLWGAQITSDLDLRRITSGSRIPGNERPQEVTGGHNVAAIEYGWTRKELRGNATNTVRDREAPGSNPGPPTNFWIQNRLLALYALRLEGTAVSQNFLKTGFGQSVGKWSRTSD